MSPGWAGGPTDMVPRSAYETAKAGGRHAGLLRTYQAKSTIQRALRSYERRVVSLMQQQALAFGIELEDVQIDNLEPDRDLV